MWSGQGVLELHDTGYKVDLFSQSLIAAKFKKGLNTLGCEDESTVCVVRFIFDCMAFRLQSTSAESSKMEGCLACKLVGRAALLMFRQT